MASSGVSSVYGLTYDTVDPSAGKAVARKNAWNDAVAKAKQYAQLSGRKLGKVLIIEETTASYYPYYFGAANSTMGQLAAPGTPNAGSAVELPVGFILVTVIVFVTWELVCFTNK